MTTKITKTLVFAALIAAMILPFGGMQSAEAIHVEGAEHVTDGSRQVGTADGSHGPGEQGTPDGSHLSEEAGQDGPDGSHGLGEQGTPDGSHLSEEAGQDGPDGSHGPDKPTEA